MRLRARIRRRVGERLYAQAQRCGMGYTAEDVADVMAWFDAAKPGPAIAALGEYAVGPVVLGYVDAGLPLRWVHHGQTFKPRAPAAIWKGLTHRSVQLLAPFPVVVPWETRIGACLLALLQRVADTGRLQLTSAQWEEYETLQREVAGAGYGTLRAVRDRMATSRWTYADLNAVTDFTPGMVIKVARGRDVYGYVGRSVALLYDLEVAGLVSDAAAKLRATYQAVVWSHILNYPGLDTLPGIDAVTSPEQES